MTPASIRNRPSMQEVSDAIAYDPETGKFTWRDPLRARKAKNCKAGWITSEGYLRITISGKKYQATHLAWLIVHGTRPDEMIDHINGFVDDNRIANLRLATNAQNQMNKKARISGATGMKGVARIRRRGRIEYKATITVDGQQKFLGMFKSADAAYAAYRDAALREFGQYARV